MGIKTKKLVIILCLICFILPLKINTNNYFFDNHPELQPKESLKKFFSSGLEFCKDKNFRVALEDELCSWEYVKSKSISDYKTLENIRYYCLYNTDNECDRRDCIEKIILNYADVDE